MVAVYQHRCAYKVARQLLRRAHQQQATVFDVWLHYTKQRRQQRLGMQQMASQAAYAKLAAAFTGWAEWAAASAGQFVLLLDTKSKCLPIHLST